MDKSQESQKGLRGVIGISFISRVTDMMGQPMDPTKEQEGGWLHVVQLVSGSGHQYVEKKIHRRRYEMRML